MNWAVLDTAIKGGSITSSIPPEITHGINYKLTPEEIGHLLDFWKEMKVINLAKIDDNDNFNLAFRKEAQKTEKNKL